MRFLTPSTHMRLFVAHGIVLHFAGFDAPLGESLEVNEFEEKTLDGTDVLAVKSQWSGLNYYILPEEASPRAKQLGELWSRAMAEMFSGISEKRREEAREKAALARTYLEREWRRLTKVRFLVIGRNETKERLRGGL